jgi:aminopeptidase N
MVKSAAAAALGALRTTAARDALLAAIGEAHPRARRGIVRALGEFRGDRTCADALRAIVEGGDPSYFVEAEACHALGRLRLTDAFDAIARAAERPSYLDVIRQYAWRGLAELRDDRAFDLLLEGTRYGRVSHGRRAAIGALAELARGRRDAQGRRTRERAEELLRDPDFRVQAAALEALGQLADPAATAALDDLIARELDGRLRRRARELARDLAEGRAAGEQIATLRDDVDKLRADVVRLREQVERLEGPRPADAPASPAPAPAPVAAAPPATRAKARAARPATKRSGRAPRR